MMRTTSSPRIFRTSMSSIGVTSACIVFLLSLHCPEVSMLSMSSALRTRVYSHRTAHALSMSVQEEGTLDVEGLQSGMKMRKIANSDLTVSQISLGTMMFGEQLSKLESIAQLDIATKQLGINFLNTAEIFPSPADPSTHGRSEKIIGGWLKQSKQTMKREDVVIASKICGYSNEITWCRKNGEETRLTRAQIMEAVDAQLLRLGTDYLDLLEFHWPERYVPLEGAPQYDYELEREGVVPIVDQLEAVQELLKSGKIRAYGLSNETPYGVGCFTTTAKLMGLPVPSCVENPFNLLERNDFEMGMQEACSPRNGGLSMLAFSPLAGGALTGKYVGDMMAVDKRARMKLYAGFYHRYIAPPSQEAVRAYMKVAQDYALPLSTLALSWVYGHPSVTSTIIGASSTDQLVENVMALNVPHNEDINTAMDAVFRRHTDPTKGVFEVFDPNAEYIDPAKLPWGSKDEDVDPELDVLINQRLSKEQ